jgi:hypothetical protein
MVCAVTTETCQHTPSAQPTVFGSADAADACRRAAVGAHASALTLYRLQTERLVTLARQHAAAPARL